MANTARVTQSVVVAGTLQNGTARVTQSVLIVAVGLGVNCGSPPPGNVGIPYSHTFPAGGGQAPVVFTSTGNLPPGLVLGASTGTLAGNPTVAGLFAFTVLVTDALTATASVACSITVTGGGGQSPVGGLPFKVGRCLAPNEWDECLLWEMKRMRGITPFPDMCVIPKEYRNELPWPVDGEWGSVPEQAVRFNKTGGIVTPTTVSGDNVVVSWRVPVGYDGLLTGTYFGYSGSGFVQGSGDIITRLRINQRYVKDLSNNPFLLGSPVLPLPMTEGQILLSGMTVQSIVNVPNLSGQIVVGQSTIFAGQVGFLWPRG